MGFSNLRVTLRCEVSEAWHPDGTQIVYAVDRRADLRSVAVRPGVCTPVRVQSQANRR
jgi:hypothetical protein